MKRFSVALLAMVLALGFALAGPALAADPIKVGILGPFTGSLAHNAGEMKKGILLALDQINGAGGINGRPIELIFGDSACKPAVGVAAVKKLLNRDEVLVVGGGYSSSVNIATSEVSDAERTPQVVAIAITPTITNRGYEVRVPHQPQQPHVPKRHQRVAGQGEKAQDRGLFHGEHRLRPRRPGDLGGPVQEDRGQGSGQLLLRARRHRLHHPDIQAQAAQARRDL